MTTTTGIQIVADVIQRTYGDATQTVLDHQAARESVSSLRAAGWMSPSEVAAIVLAAGGRVTVLDEHVRAGLDETHELIVWDDYSKGPGARTIAARPKRP